MVEIKNLTKIYEGGVKAIDDVSLSIEKGDIYGIIGLSGAGKSSLIRCINRLEEPTSGKVIIDGEDITAMDEKFLMNKRRRIGMIFQHFNLLKNSTVFENIAFALRLDKNISEEYINQRVEKLLDIVDLKEKRDSYPSQLSGGQKQRVGIARALANEVDLLLCDEATSALDPKTTSQILDLLAEINKKFSITIILITHQMEVIRQVCNKVAIIDGGKIRISGDVIDVFSSPGDEVTRHFIEKEYHLPEQLQREKLIYITFTGESAMEALISTASRQLNLDINIISGNIDYIQGSPLGKLCVQVDGDENIKKLVEFLISQKVKAEVR